jgi:ribosomal protein L44E
MVQHYTLLTVEVSEWCNKCRKHTPHRVADRRLQFCIPCWDRSQAESDADKAKPKPAEQIDLFN